MLAKKAITVLNVGISVKKVSKMAELKIKSCPFCGGEAFLKDGNPTTFGTFEALVICKNCSASVVGVSRINFATYRFEKNGYDLARKQAVKAWNRRDDK
jgi:hypothetical protein